MHTLFKRTGTFSKIDYILSHETSINNFRGFNLYKVYADQNIIKLEINDIILHGKLPNMRKLNNALLNNPMVIENNQKRNQRVMTTK